MIRLLARPGVGLICGVALTLGVVLAVPTATARWLDAPVAAPAAVGVTVAPVAPVLHYQGRLLDPTTGQAKADGVYPITFRLYGAASGGSPLWTESKSVTVSRGLFATLLGDTTALDLAHFDGRELYLGVTVGSDPEAQPRQRIAFVAYALYAANADTLGGQDATAFAPANHTHDGSAIVSGIVAEPRIDASITRDEEVMPIILARGGPGSGINADLLDGIDSSVLYKGHIGTQVSNSLTAGNAHHWTTWGYSPDRLVVWWARPTTEGGQLKLEVQTELEPCCGQGQGLIRYHLFVTNTSTVTTNYDLVRYTFYQ